MRCWKKKTLKYQQDFHVFKLNIQRSKLGEWFTYQLWGAMDFLDNVEDDAHNEVSMHWSELVQYNNYAVYFGACMHAWITNISYNLSY